MPAVNPMAFLRIGKRLAERSRALAAVASGAAASVTAALLAVSLAALPRPAAAQDRAPVEWIIGYGAGGGSHMVALTVAEAMSRTLGRAITVTPKPGAATNIAAEYVAKHPADGNILFTADFATLATNPWLYAKLNYNAERDFMPVGMLAKFPFLLVVPPGNPARTLPEFVAWAKANQGNVTYASVGAGSPHHLVTELLSARLGIPMKPVHYRGAAAAVKDVVGGQVSFAMMDTAAIQEPVRAGTVRAIGVASLTRLPGLPQVQTLHEQGLSGFDAFAWQGVVVPRGTPPAVVAAFSQALTGALESPEIQARLHASLLEPLPGTPEQMTAFVRAERERWGGLIHSHRITID